MTGSGALTDVEGVHVGHAQRIGDGWLTGVTVVLPPPGTLGAVEVRGAAPATRETDALAAGAVRPYPDAIVLTGGSAFGLAAADGVLAWCAEQGRGLGVGADPDQVVPLVAAAAVYDLGRGGDRRAVPDAALGRAAAQAASAETARGTVGAGTGATVDDERAKGGVGTASTVLTWAGGRVAVGALVVVNAYGTLARGPHGDQPRPRELGRGPTAPAHTTLVVVATDAVLDHGALARTAAAGHTGLARVLDPVHTLADGDAVFALATGRVRLPSEDDVPHRHRDAVIAVQTAAAHVVAAAVVDAVRSATAVRTPAADLSPLPI